MTLKISISGIRGISGDSLTDEIVSDFSKAFASFIKKGTIVIGRDSRPSGEKIKDIFISNLNSHGLNVIYLGICPTPTVQFMVKYLKADGGVVITASHNPAQWNGLKFVRKDGIFLNAEQANELIRLYDKKDFITSKRAGKAIVQKDPLDPHVNSVLNCVDVPAIKKRKFKVALDSCNGAGSVITVKLLKGLGCDIVELNTDENGKIFPHNPEPIPENLIDLCRTVRESRADIGFAQDADADRLAIVTDKGEAPGEEYTLAIAADHVLSNVRLKAPGAKDLIITNLSTSMMSDDIAAKYGARVIRTRIGEVNVAEEMVKQNGVIGGEGNGGVMYPLIGYDRDSLIGISLLLDALAASDKHISGLIDSLPKYSIVKKKLDCSSKAEADSLLDKVRSKFAGEKFDLTEGIKVILPKAWVHVRASNTEPVIRIIAEAESREKAMALINRVID